MKDCLIIALASIVIGGLLFVELSADMYDSIARRGMFEWRGELYRVTKMDAPK